MNEFSNARNTASAADEEHEPAPQEARADTAPDPAVGGFRATWARTTNNARIGKVKTPSGKWPPTQGAKSLRFIFEARVYANIMEFYVDCEAKLKSGCWALIAGELRPDLDPNQPHQRVGTNFIDVASTKLTSDFDGLEPDDPGAPIDGADAFASDAAVFIALDRMPEAFKHAACMVYATASTGSKIISTGKPSEGKARLRATWEMTRALTCKQKEIVTKAIKARPGLSGVSNDLCALAGFEFINRPVFLEGEIDPIEDPVHLLEGGLLDIDAVCAELGIDLDVESGDARTSGSAGQGGPWTAKKGLALDLPPEQAKPLLRTLLMAIGNGSGLRDGYNGWFGVIAASFNASKGAEWGREIAVEWTGLAYDTREVDEKWKALTKSGDGRNGVDYLIKLAVALAKEKQVEAAAGDDAAKAKAEELEAAVSSIDRARAAATRFPDDADTLAAQKARKTGWDELKEALRWPGKDEALKSRSNIAQNQFGFAQIGMGASNAPPMARQWITDRHARGHVSMTNGLPASGKTKLAVAYAHAIATERPGLAGISEIDRHGAVAFIALDNERREEFDLEGKAFRKHHGLQPGDFKHRIHVIDNCGPLVERQLGGDLGPSRSIVALAPQLAWLREHENLSLIFIDTLLSAAGGADTSDGPAMAAIMRIGKELADMLNCSDDFINHLTKGGAIRDPDSMDAALGARSVSAIPRFMTNLKREGDYVRVVQAKRSYLGPRGCSLYEFKSVDIVSTRPEDPTRTVIENVGILVPAAKAAMAEVFAVENAHQALWEAHDKQKVKIKRGSRRTGRGQDHASMIIENAGVVNDAPPALRRAKAEHLRDLLIKDGRLKVVKETLGRHLVEVVVPEEPEERV